MDEFQLTAHQIIKELTAERDALRAELAETEHARDKIEVELEEWQAAHDKLEYANGILTGERDVMTECRDALCNERDALRAENKILLEAAMGNLTFATLRRERNTLLKERDALVDAVDEFLPIWSKLKPNRMFTEAVHLRVILNRIKKNLNIKTGFPNAETAIKDDKK